MPIHDPLAVQWLNTVAGYPDLVPAGWDVQEQGS